MTPKETEIDPGRLGERLEALPGIERLRAAAGEAPVHLVGGAVRDLLLGRERTDIDVVVEGDSAELAHRLGGEVRSHDRFGTASVSLDGLTIDLATARAESYPAPGALPEVRPASLADDLARRDFTINAMAVRIAGEAKLVDPHGGLADLRGGLLRVLHPASLRDDPTRALRAARYAARLRFDLEAETARLVAAADLGTVSRDRVEAELHRIAEEGDPTAALALVSGWGLINISDARLELVASLALLLASTPWSEVAGRGDAIVAAVGGDLGGAENLGSQAPERASDVVTAARGHNGVELALARALGADWLDDYVGGLRDVRLEIGGAELIEAGVPEGPAVGRGLAAALRAKLDGETSGAEDELRQALEAARAPAGSAGRN
jgi:tRNA nucleotidyltransferase (CCA-adding enzyme)